MVCMCALVRKTNDVMLLCCAGDECMSLHSDDVDYMSDDTQSSENSSATSKSTTTGRRRKATPTPLQFSDYIDLTYWTKYVPPLRSARDHVSELRCQMFLTFRTLTGGRSVHVCSTESYVRIYFSRCSCLSWV